jgi:hypothetical protein
VYYLNDKNEVVSKSKATIKNSYEFDLKGDIIWSEETRI